MKHIGLILILSTFFSLYSFAQVQKADLYKKAYKYLNDSILKNDYPSASILAKNCNECCVTGKTMNFKANLQVAKKFIENNHGFPYNDFAIKKYNFSDDCLRSWRLGIRDCELGNYVLDSLDRFWENYEMKKDGEIIEYLKDLPSDSKDGYQVFFSDIYENTIAAELKSFCLPYDETIWMGSSTSFYFIFNDLGEIEDIYSGTTIHYN